MKKSSNKGFTLVELIIVIAILAIIMLIAIPNFSGIQQRMQVRADKATAAQIGKAVRVWFTDYTTDKTLVEVAAKESDAKESDVGDYTPEEYKAEEDVKFNGLPLVTAGVVNYEKLVHIEGYISKGSTPSSLMKDKAKVKGQFYGIGLTNPAPSSECKIVVAITADGETITDTSKVNYDGKAAGIAYIEP